MKTSRAFMRIEKNKGSHAASTGAVITSPKRTNRTVCPAVMLAKRRTLREKGLANRLMISMGIMMGTNSKGTPDGHKILKKPAPCFINPVTRLMAKPRSAKNPVTMIWLVTV